MGRESYSGILQDVTTNSGYEVKRLEVPGGFLVFVRDTSATPSQFQLILLNTAPDSNWIIES